MNEHRILLATDVPFWKRSTGAQQRIHSLARFFQKPPFSFRVFYLGSESIPELMEFDRVTFDSTRPPRRPLKRARWYFDAVINRLSGGTEAIADKPRPSMKLDDYRWPWAAEQFREAVDDFRPTTIVIEYVTMAYLIEDIDRRDERPKLVLDTHDVLSSRCQQFREAGHDHWLDISAEEESRVLEKFDLVLAIQPGEQEQLRQLSAKPEILVVGHTLEPSDAAGAAGEKIESDDGADRLTPVTLGYLGSSNAANVDGLREFLNTVWPKVVESHADSVRLLIAGPIAESDIEEITRDNSLIETQPEIPSLIDFYGSVDIVINPIDYGTGLKIKSVEAIQFGKPLVTTSAGALGLSQACREVCCVVERIDQMTEPIDELIHSPFRRDQLSTQSLKIAQTEFSEQRVFGALRQWLLSAPS